VRQKLAKYLTRQNAAYALMGAFILCSTVGAAMIFIPAGLLVLGATCGLYAYLLGSD
jgi:hypothetical protein